MTSAPKPPPWCFRCAADASDGVRLFTANLARPFIAADGERTTRTIPVRLCGECVEAAIEASAWSSRRRTVDLLEPSPPRPPRVRTARGTYATRTKVLELAAAGRDG